MGTTALMAQTVGNGKPGKPQLQGVRDKQVSLSWQSAEKVYGIFDNFEDHPNFAINSAGEVGWRYIDMDKDNEYLIGSYIFENSGQPAAFRIWNPSATVPAYVAQRGAPHSGNKCLISFATLNDTRNDWVISPDLASYNFTDEITLSFWARTFNKQRDESFELINVGYSTTNLNPSSFTMINRSPIEVPESTIEHPDMYYFEYKFPANAKYIAIQCVTYSGQALLIDDIAIATNRLSPNKSSNNYVTGYNLYRDETKVNTDLIQGTSASDLAPDFGTYNYTVEAVFEDGSKVKSEALSVVVPNHHLLPFYEDWQNYNFTTNYWTLSADNTEYASWRMGYKEGGLIEYAAQFSPRFSYKPYGPSSLTSKELDATGLEGVMMCYDLAAEFYTYTGAENKEDYLKVEVLPGGSSEWMEVKKHIHNLKDDKGFNYTRFYIDLTDKVAGKKFQIRFTGGGENAANLAGTSNGWFIKYIRVYEKAQANLSGKVTCAGNPVNGAAITFSGTEGDVYKATTDESGNYTIAGVDKGTYVVKSLIKAYNPYKSEEMAIEKGQKTIDIAMTQPVIAAQAEKTYELKAEETVNDKIVLSNTGNGPATVRLSLNYGTITGQAPKLKPLTTFRPKDVMESAICFDGNYFYTAMSHEYAEGIIFKYDKEGNFIESFTPGIHVRRYFGMAFDGRYFYTANHDSIIRKIDFETHEIVEEIPTPVSNINHIAYNAERDAFYVGCLNSLALVSKTGELLEDEWTWENGECLFAGSVYDPYFKDGPTMWILDQSSLNNAANPYTYAVIRRLNLTTMEIVSDYEFDCSELPGFVWGMPSTGKVWGEAMFGTTLYKEGHFVMMGTMLSDPGLIYILDMYETDNWVKPSTYSVKVGAGETKEIPYTIDAADLKDGQKVEAKINIKCDPAIADGLYTLKLTVNGKSPVAKPTALSAEVQNDRAAVLKWTAPAHAEGGAPSSFKIYRNGVAAGTAQAGATTYTDNNLKAGSYKYEVTAVYAAGESKKSNVAEAEIETGLPCYRPQALTAKTVLNKTVELSWRNPSEVGNVPATARWDNGELYDTVSAYGASFMGAVLWMPSDLADYRNMKLDGVTFIPITPGAEYIIKIWQGNTLIHEQAAGKDFTPQQPYTVKLSKTFTINDAEKLRVAVAAGVGASLGVDAGPAVNGRGNLVFYGTGNRWEWLSVMGGGDGNFIIALELQPKETPETNTAKGYDIYRDGVKINTSAVTTTSYTDTPTGPGLYQYTVTALHDNCESYATAAVKARIVDLSGHPAPEDLSARIVMNRDVKLTWNYPNTHLDAAAKNGAAASDEVSADGAASTADGAAAALAEAEKAGFEPFGYVKDFDFKGTAEAAVVTDGQYIYTSFYNANGAFNQYDMSGKFVSSFTISGVGPIIDLTYDGRYFYGGDATSAVLFCMDFTSKTLVKKMNVTSPVRHCAYIPELDGGKGGFEIGDWTTSYFVSLNGSYLNKGYQSPEGAFGAAYADGKLYYFQQKSPSRCEIIEVDFATLKSTGKKAYLNQYSQYAVNTGARAGGLASFTSQSGSTMLLADIQNAGSPNKLVWVEASQNIYVSGFNLYRDDRKLNTEPLSVREFAEKISVAGEYNYKVSAIYIDGEEGEKTAALKVKIVAPTHCEAPVNVKALVRDRDVRLQWTSVIDQSAPKDDMENYAHLSTGTIGDYITLDADHRPTYKPLNWSFDKVEEPGSFYVLDQSALTPAQTDLAYSGNKFLAAFGAVKNEAEVTGYSADWIILPLATVSTEKQWISFVARGLEVGSKEHFRVGYSTDGTDTTNFVFITKTAEEVNCLWKRFVFDLPAGTKYAAIEYVSGNGTALLIDDISIAKGACVFRPDAALSATETFVEKVMGYYIYRDGVSLNSEPLLTNVWFDGNLPNGQYQYTVKALYNTSCESALSETAQATVNYVSPKTAPRNLSGKANKDSVSLTWKAPAYAPDQTLTYSLSEEESAMGFYDDRTYYTAYHWEVGELLGAYGYEIEAVEGWFFTKPTKLNLVIYQDGKRVYDQDVTSLCEENKRTMFKLETPFLPDYTKSLTVGFRIEAPGETMTTLFDKGPVVANRGDYFSNDGFTWTSADYSYGTKGNWMINVYLNFPVPATGMQNGLQGYLVYRDSEPARKELVKETQYKDFGLRNGVHTFAVSAVYDDGERKSEEIKVNVSGASNEELGENRLRLYPNPTANRFTVYGAFLSLDITDMDGRLCVRHYGAQGDEVNVSGLSAGVYVVRITCREGVAVRKLVITK